MPRDNLSRLEVEIYNATRKLANKLNKENNNKNLYFAKMEDQASNGNNSTIFKLESLGNLKINGFARAIYIYDPYSEEDWKILIDGNKIRDEKTGKYVNHPIVLRYEDFLIKEVFGIKSKIS